MTQKKDQQAWEKACERMARELNELGDTLPNVMMQVLDMTPIERQEVYELLEAKFGIDNLEIELAKAIQEVRGKP